MSNIVKKTKVFGRSVLVTSAAREHKSIINPVLTKYTARNPIVEFVFANPVLLE